MKKNRSVVFKLSVKFSTILTAAVLLIICVFFMLMTWNSRQQDTRGLLRTIALIEKPVAQENQSFLDKRIQELPFFISYTIYDSETKEILQQKNDRLGILQLTDGKTIHYTTKKVFNNSENTINILYMTKEVETVSGKKYTIQIATNAKNDAGNKFILDMLFYIALAAVPILLISFLLSLYITKHTMEPVVKITNAAKSISSTNLDNILPTSGKKDELDNLAQTFNDLFSRLKVDFDRERSFTSNVSHELKTPVAVVLGQANLLRRWGKDDPAQLEKSLNTILSESRSMEAIISNLLQLSRLDSGKIKPELAPLSLKELFERTAAEFTAIKPEAEIAINLPEDNGKANEFMITSDVELLHQMLTILVQNSLKFADKKPAILLTAWQNEKFKNEEETITIQVIDNGPGFEMEILPHVFERFFRGDSAHVRSAGGSGLGLSIAKAISESLNGSIKAENAPQGGALITVSLPCQPVK